MDELSRTEREAAVEIVTEMSAVAVLAAVNPALGVLGSSLVELHRAGLFPAWMRFLDREVSHQEVRLDPTDPMLAAAFQRLTTGALQTARSEKWRLLAAALVSTARGIESEDFLVEHFAELVVRFSPEHVRVLQMMVDPEGSGLSLESIDAEHLLDALVGSVGASDRSDYELIINAVWGDLVAYGLIGAGFVAGFNRVVEGALVVEEATQYPEPPHKDEGVTPAGLRFLAYLSLH